MKKRFLILAMIILSGLPDLSAQVNTKRKVNKYGHEIKVNTPNQYDMVDNEIIVKFKEGVLSNDFLESKEIKRNVANAKNSNSKSNLSNSFFTKYNNNQLRKIIKKYKPSYGSSIARTGKRVNTFDFHNLMILEIGKQENVLEICDKISEYEEIEYAEPNYLIKLNDNPPNDTDYGNQEGFEQTSDADIDANRAWDFTTGDYRVKVGVIDNGIDYHNIDLGNGVFGVNGAKVRGGWDYINNDADPDYTDASANSHGTEVAGIIAGIRNNNVGISGLAGGDGHTKLGAQLFALKVGPVECSDGTLRCLSTDKIIDAIIEGSMDTPNFGYGCHVLNNSYGSYNYNESMRYAISIAVQNNVVFVASKGNDNIGDLHYPSDYDRSWVVSVGASNLFDNRAWFSNTGNGIDVVAPGSGNVFTTGIGTNTFENFSGTSASSPHVAGLSALILSEAIEQGISLHHEDVENLIEVSSEDVNGGGYDDDLGHGRINAGRALEMMNEPWELTHHTTTGGTIVNSEPINSGCIGLSCDNNVSDCVIRHEVEVTVSVPFFTGNEFFAWGRGSNASTGWSDACPNYQIGFCEVIGQTTSEITLRTYVYEYFSTSPFPNTSWYPTVPENVVFAYTTLGTPCPDTRNVWQEISPGTRNDQVVFSAGNDITANNFITSGSGVLYSAGNQIRLLPGFHAENGSKFQTSLDGCAQVQMNAIVATNSRSNDIQSYNQTDLETVSENDFVNALNDDVQIYPNPFDNFTTIAYSLSKDSNVEIKVFNNKGREVATLVDNNPKEHGQHYVNFGSTSLKPGIFHYIIKTNLYTKSGKFIKQ